MKEKREIRNVMNFFGLKVLKLKNTIWAFFIEKFGRNLKEIEEIKINNFLKQLNFSYEIISSGQEYKIITSS